MKHAETVTFGGGGLDRADLVRGDADALDRLRSGPEARAIVSWRGKPLVDLDANCLQALPLDHEMLRHAKEAPLFLGLADGVPVFSFDISSWTPADIEPQALGQFLDPSVNHHPAMPENVVFAELRGIMTQLGSLDAELAATARALHNWHGAHHFCAKCGARSDIGKAGWLRVCPSCDAQHFPRTDPVVIMLITHGNNVLLGRSPHWPEGMYSLLAGFMEPGETIEAAVRREVYEETGVAIGPVSYLSSQPWPFPSSLMIGCHGTANTTAISLDDLELADARWVSREALIDVMIGRDEHMKPARKGAIARFLLDNWLADTLD